MPGTFAYAAATNTVTVTGGTSGSPADFASFVTADRGGTGTSLLAAWAPNSNTKALTYQVRPVELLALLISFVVAGKTAETDYIFVTGTDWLNNAQTEAINVSAGNGTYVTTKYFRTITNIDCSDSATGGGTVWADGTVAVTQPIWGVIWNKGNGQYELDTNRFNVGNGSTFTYFQTSNEQIVFGSVIIDGSSLIYCNNNATFQSGILVDLTSKTTKNGSTFLCKGAGYRYIENYGTIYLYSTALGGDISEWKINNTTRNWNSVFMGGGAYPLLAAGNSDLYNLIIANTKYGFRIDYGVGTVTINSVTVQGTSTSFYIVSAPFLMRNVVSINSTRAFTLWKMNYGDGVLIDCTLNSWAISDTSVGQHSYDIYRKYSVNLHLANRAGVNISGATVTLKDVNGTQVFSVSTGADGKIAEQLVTHTKYDHTASWAAVTYGPHTLTITNAGYQTYQDVITIDRKMDLEVALSYVRTSPTNLGLVPLGIKQVAI
jgi:hypothetical protein